MFELFKTFHFLFLVLGAGAGIGALFLNSAVKSAEGPPPPWVGKLRFQLVRTSLLSVILIWLTGLYLIFSFYGGWQPGLPFTLKMIAASLLLLGIIAANILLNLVRKTGTPNPLIPKLGMVNVGLTILAVIFAVYAFNS
ncbi:MAG: hypothetical protein V3V02_02845 [Rhizobiaceae bacterium]